MLSIIIPTLNEATHIAHLIKHLYSNASFQQIEIVISDGGSSDNTVAMAKEAGAEVVISPKPGRATQMNYGAGFAKGDILYFVHADVIPPKSYLSDIEKAIQDGYDVGRYITEFNTTKWYLKLNAFFTRFDWFVCYGGDQTMFVTKHFFDAHGGFNNNLRIMEDYEITERLRTHVVKYCIIKKGVLISDRKYQKNNWWKVQMANSIMIKMYKQGADQSAMVEKYKSMLR